ncbi:MAG: hypothetical protein QNL91_01695 [Candidatus Krumholzibacteria bacterium]|nr:hypothetical protein [Candidatus Krumholzibacteria bacterium]
MASNKMIMTLMLIALVSLAFTGCSDSDDNPAAVVLDTAPPAVPAELDLQYSDGSATISWAQNTVDSDLAGYIVTRERYGVVEDMVAAPALINSYIDANPLSGSSEYHVYSVDTSGNASAVSTTYLTVALVHRSHELSN